MFKTTIEFDEVLRLRTMEFTYLADAIVWQAFQDFLSLIDGSAAMDWYNDARLDGDGLAFRRSHYTIQITEKGYKVILHEEKGS